MKKNVELRSTWLMDNARKLVKDIDFHIKTYSGNNEELKKYLRKSQDLLKAAILEDLETQTREPVMAMFVEYMEETERS